MTDSRIDLDQIMVSPRDKQPYVVVYGARLDPYGRDILAYEKDADANGERYVVMTDGSIQRMTQQQFDAANR